MDFKNNIITIKDDTILTFYRENPNLDFITMNYILIDILKKLSINLTETMNNTINLKIYEKMNNYILDFSTFKNEFITFKNNDLTNQTNNIIEKLIDTKREYLEEIKLVLSNNSLTNIDKINNIVDKNNEILLNKTNNMINEIIPKTQETYHKQITNNINELTNFITEENLKILQNTKNDDNDKEFVKKFIDNIDNQYNKMITNLQQPIFTYIQASEERTNSNIQRINDKIQKQETLQETLNNEMRGFLSRYTNNSSIKGKISETELYSILQVLFPSENIVNSSTQTANCDYCVFRKKQKPAILFENKDYNRSVTTEEVDKFQRDIKKQQIHGILLSQNTGITFKENYQIDIIDGLIHIYIHNVNYSVEKIKIAIDIIDNLAQKLDIFTDKLQENTTTIHIDNEDIENIHNEYVEFNQQKQTIIENIKSSNKDIIERIETLQMCSIKKLLSKNKIINDNELLCNNCNVFIGKNKASLAQHIRKCKSGKIINASLITPQLKQS